jgi:hypothetical protein
MSEAAPVAQEDLRTVTVSAKVTKAENDAFRIVAAFDSTTVSDLLRDCTIVDVMERAGAIHDLRDRFGGKAGGEGS